jgi:hypothetical protein
MIYKKIIFILVNVDFFYFNVFKIENLKDIKIFHFYLLNK